MTFTVITEYRVLRVKAPNIQRLTQALHAAGIVAIGIWHD